MSYHVSLREQARRARVKAERDAVTDAVSLRLDKSGPGGCWVWKGNTYTTDRDVQAERSAHYRSACPVSLGCVNPAHR